jgi:hypothetical protein
VGKGLKAKKITQNTNSSHNNSCKGKKTSLGIRMQKLTEDAAQKTLPEIDFISF